MPHQVVIMQRYKTKMPSPGQVAIARNLRAELEKKRANLKYRQSLIKKRELAMVVDMLKKDQELILNSGSDPKSQSYRNAVKAANEFIGGLPEPDYFLSYTPKEKLGMAKDLIDTKIRESEEMLSLFDKALRDYMLGKGDLSVFDNDYYGSKTVLKAEAF